MAKSKLLTSQKYPRIEDEDDKYHGFLDDTKLKEHTYTISISEMKKIIADAIINANKKTSRTILKISSEDSPAELYKRIGSDIFKYFVKYCGDPASTAHTCFNRHYSVVCKEQFRNNLLQKQRMNSGWRYQYIAKDAAIKSKRFASISDIGSQEADFNATINIKDQPQQLSIYISVKNRSNTMGGQDWPKAIRALEDVAKNDKNRTDAYICVFGIAMEKGKRVIRCEKKTGAPYSYNTEIWMSDYFWPFFTNYSYDKIIKAVLDVLIEKGDQDEFEFDIPKELVESFGECCRSYELLDESGKFNDAYKLVNLFCGNVSKPLKGGK